MIHLKYGKGFPHYPDMDTETIYIFYEHWNNGLYYINCTSCVSVAWFQSLAITFFLSGVSELKSKHKSTRLLSHRLLIQTQCDDSLMGGTEKKKNLLLFCHVPCVCYSHKFFAICLCVFFVVVVFLWFLFSLSQQQWNEGKNGFFFYLCKLFSAKFLVSNWSVWQMRIQEHWEDNTHNELRREKNVLSFELFTSHLFTRETDIIISR